MGVAMLNYSYQCADLNLNVNQGVITAKSFKNTINNWSGMVNLHVPKKWVFGEKFKRQSTRLEDSLSWEEIRARKHRRKVIISSSEPSSSLVLFFFRSASSLFTPVAQANPSPSTFPAMVPMSTQCGLLLHLVYAL